METHAKQPPKPGIVTQETQCNHPLSHGECPQAAIPGTLPHNPLGRGLPREHKRLPKAFSNPRMSLKSVRAEKGRLQGEDLLSERIEGFERGGGQGGGGQGGGGQAVHTLAATTKVSWSFPFPLPSTSSPGPSGPAEGSAVASSAAALAPHAAGVQQFSFALLHP